MAIVASPVDPPLVMQHAAGCILYSCTFTGRQSSGHSVDYKFREFKTSRHFEIVISPYASEKPSSFDDT